MSIRIENANLRLGTKTVLDNVSLQFNAAELCIILGPNGTGKSSLLKLITREWQGDGTTLFFYQQPSDMWQPAQLAKSLGILPQASSLSFAFTAKEVVELGGLTLSAPHRELQAIVERAMQQTDVAHLAQRLYPSLSGGEKQRVHLARVLTQLAQSPQPPILLLDEPTAALDITHQHHCLQLAKQMASEGATVIAVVHSLNLAARYADRIIMLNNGHIFADGTPAEVLTAANIEQLYGWQAQVFAHPTLGYPVVL